MTITKLNSSFGIDSKLEFTAQLYSGHFFKDQYLYLTTTAGEVVRVITNPLIYNGTMTISVPSFTGAPELGATTMSIDSNIAWTTCKWWGTVVRLQLDSKF
jgi:hypothetical protein